MKSKVLLVGLAVFLGFKAAAQVSDEVNVIIAPTAGYNWFDKKTTVEDALMYGIQAGFGFGEVMEFRGVYEQSSNNIGQRFGKYSSDLQDLVSDYEFADRDVKVSRIGGEIKANLPVSKKLDPFLLVGTGVQTFERKFEDAGTYKTDNLYATAGLGLKFNLSDRVTFNLEGRTYLFNMNPQNMLANPDYINSTEDPSFGNWFYDQDSRKMVNWSLNAGLQFYLAGRNHGDLSSLERAYKQRFSSGLSGFKVTLAPLASYVDFDSKTGYKDTYLLGAELGLDFSDFFGINAYYLRSTEDEKVNLDFDKLAMYGADFVGRLNVARGIVPYITLGAGYLDVLDGYEPESYERNTPSKLFVKGGLGLDVPLSTRVELFGAANLVYTTDNETSDVTTLESTDQLRNHAMYNLGLRFKLGKKIDTDRATQKAFDERFSGERQSYRDSIRRYDDSLKKYEDRVNELENDLKEDYDKNDVERMNEIMKEKQAVEADYKEQTRPANDTLIRMSPKEFESLIDKVLRSVDEEEGVRSESSLEGRLDRMEELLMNMNRSGEPSTRSLETDSSTRSSEDTSANERLIEEIGKLQKRIDEQQATIGDLRSDTNTAQKEARRTRNDGRTNVVDNRSETTQDGSGFIYNKGMSVHIGPNFGDISAFNVGVR